MWGWFFCVAAAAVLSSVQGAGAGAARLVCYVESARATDGFSECTHLVYAGDARGDKLDALLKEYRKNNPRLKIVLRVAEVDKDLRKLLKSKHVQGLEIHDAHKTLNKTKVSETVEAARSALTSSGGGPLFLALPAHPELLAKYYDLRTLVKKADLMMVQTHALGLVKKMTYHPSRLSGLWDMMNTDSVVDLVVGLGIPASKVVISLPATVRQFTLANETLSTPGSPTVEDDPKEIDQAELCRQLQKGRWTLERDQDLSAPYAFKDKTWMSFEDASSVDVKGKYARVRGLAGLALHAADRDARSACGPSLKASLANVLNQQSRAPRAAVLRSLEHEILSAPRQVRALDALQVSPYRITQVVDADGVIHSIREDTRTEFSCSRQGYFVHPRSCARFYRCVKFDQLSPEYTVFEFDCPAGLAFDARYEVCVWPGSLPHSQACPGSSEIAPVPKTRFICPDHEGYYADPENCRWFFACLDHGKAPLTAYEFRCPFGLGFDADKLKCDWPWLVPACGNIARYEAEAFGYSGASLTGAAGFYGQTADSVNVAAHQSLVSGASLNNLVGIQNGFLSKDDALDSNFIASQELGNGAYSGAGQSFQVGHDAGHSHGGNGLEYQVDAGSLNANLGLVQATKYDDQPKYSSGSIILDDYRLPSKTIGHGSQNIGVGIGHASQNAGVGIGLGGISRAGYTTGYGYGTTSGQKSTQYQGASYDDDNSGAYVHDPTGDYAEPYKHIGSPDVPYVHADAGYKHTGDYYDTGSYSGSSQGYSGSSQGYSGSSRGYAGSYSGSSQSGYEGKYAGGNEGQYVHDNSGAYLGTESSDSGYKGDNSGAYVETGSSGSGYKGDNSGAYVKTGSSGSGYKGDNSGAYVETGFTGSGYKGGYSGSFNADLSGSSNADYSGSYNADNSGSYNADNSGSYNADNSGSYNAGSYNDNSGKYEAGVYRTDGHIGSSEGAGIGSQTTSADNTQFGSYSTANAGNYMSDSKAYTGSSHTLTAGAVNVGLVGKTTLVDVDYNDQRNYQAALNANSYSQTHHTLHPGHVSYISQPAVSINHVGTDFNNLDGYSFVTTPTSSGVPTTATPFAVTTALPAVSTYKTQFVPEAPKSSVKQIFGYTQPAVTYVQPTVVAVKEQYTPNIQVSSSNQGSSYNFESKDYNGGISASHGSGKTESGYDYSKPSIKFEDGVTYTTAAPVVSVSTYKPQGFGHSQQTLHKVESVGFQYSTQNPVTEEPFKRVVAYTTGPSVTTFAQPTVSSYSPQAFSHQTIHKVESGNAYSSDSGADFGYNAGVSFEQPKNVVQYTTSQPAIVSTYQPQVFSQQTLHQVDAGKVNTYSDASSGYDYSKPAVQFEEAVKTVQYSTPAPVVSTYRPQAYSHQTIHKVETQKIRPVFSTAVPKVEFNYQAPVSVYQNPILEYTQKATPVTYVQSTYRPKAYSQQTIHKVEDTKVYRPSIDVGSTGYSTSGVTYEQPQTVVQYTTAQPAISIQPAVSTYQPQAYSHQTIHKVDASQVNAYSQGSESGYDYSKPAVNFEEVGKTVFEYSTPAPVVSTYRPQAAKTVFEYSTAKPAVVSSYRPQSYSSQTIHKVESQKFVPVSSTPQPVDLSYQQAISTYENPILKYTKNVTPVPYIEPTAAVYTQPIVQQHQVSHVVSQPIQYEGRGQQSYEQNVQINQEGYTYSQPEIQRNIEANSAKTYSDASLVSHQFYHQSNENQYNSGKDAVFVSTSPSTLAYEDHYVDYEPNKVETYKAPEYIPPKTRYQQTYSVSTASTPIVQQSSVLHQANDAYDYKPVEYSQQFDTVQNSVPIQQVSYSTSHVSEPKRVESVHFSSLPETTFTTNYKQTYQSPEIQVGYKAEEYLPPVVSTVTPIVSSTYRPRTYSTVSSTREYLPPSTTSRPIVKSTTPSYKYVEPTYKAEEYLPPVEFNGPSVVNFETFGLDNTEATAAPKIRYNPYQDYSVPKDNSAYITQTSAPLKRKQNIVVETAKSHLLGFGTVGPDAGLVSPVTYTTGAPVIVSSTYRPIVKSTAQTPLYVQSTTEYKAPEYLPPLGESDQVVINTGDSQAQYNPYQDNSVVVSTSAPIQRKQNIVVETAKSHLLGFGTVGPDAGLVSPVRYTTVTPNFVSSTDSHKSVTSTYAPVEQGLFEVTPSSVPIRRTKPKVAVVTKINDFNPLLVRKLGAVCSCQSPVLVLKGRRPNVQQQKDFDDYSSNDYDYPSRGDINDNQWAQKTAKLRTPVVNAVTTSPVVTSTFNPIIVPDDSYYQDYQEPSNVDVIVTPKNKDVYSGSYVSSTPVYSSTERFVRVRPRIQAVTAAPTYQTVLLKQEVSPTVVVQESESGISGIDSHAFDRYGPGGLRSRDETLQGSVDCQRAGLFRHPKQCNKFYACRWDCTKQRFTLHVFNCPVQLSFDASIGACNWPSQGPACQGDTLLTNAL